MFACGCGCGDGLVLFGRHKTEPNTNTGEIRELRVVMDNNYPPYVFYNDAGNLQGILVDQWKLWEEKTVFALYFPPWTGQARRKR